MIRFSIERAVFDRFPGVRIPVAVAFGLDNSLPRPGIDALWRAAWEGAAAAAVHGNAQSHPRIRPWRERFRAMGVSGKEFPSSAEALLRRAMRGGEPFQVNPLVDFYNAISLRHAVPAGAFDLDGIEGDIALRLTREGDTFWPLDAPEPVTVGAGEVAYADQEHILTRHFVWRQARFGLIGPRTRNVLLLAEVLGEVGGDAAETVLDDFVTGLQAEFGVEMRCAVVTGESKDSVEW